MFIRESKLVNGRIHSFEFHENVSTSFHRDVCGSRICNLSHVPYTLPYWESEYYVAKLSKYLGSLDRSSRILDAGCGDGRFTMLLLDMGFTNIFALDANLDSLLDLEQKLVELRATEHVVLVHSCVTDLPFAYMYFDAALAIGVLYYLNNNYESALDGLCKCLKRDALLFETEPDQVGNAVKALIFDGLESFIKVARESKFYEYFDGKPLSLRCFSDAEMYELHKTIGLPVIGVENISLFPSLLTIARKRGMISDIDKLDDLNDQIREAFKYFDRTSDLAKHKLWVCKKE